MSTVALVGAYSMSNYGDQLYPGVLEGFLRERGCDWKVELFAPLSGRLPDGREVKTFGQLRGTAPRAVLVGGGDLIRTDRRTVALDQLNIETRRRRSPVSRIRAYVFAARAFQRRPGPWLPEAGWCPGAPTAYVSVGVHPLPAAPAVRRGVGAVRCAWVRTAQASDHLQGAGLAPEGCVLAPDAIFALPDFLDIDRVRRRGRELLRDATGSAGPVAVVHAAPFTGWDASRIASLLDELSLSMPVVTLPLGSYCGEDAMLRIASQEAGVRCLAGLPTDDVTSVLAAAGCVVSTSMHAAIVSGCLGRPVVVPGIAKTRTALAACPEPPTFVEVAPDGVAAAARDTLGQEVPPASPANGAAARAAFRRVFDTVALERHTA